MDKKAYTKMVNKELFLNRTDRRVLAQKMGKLLSKLCDDDDMYDICLRVDMVEVREYIDKLLKQYRDEWGDKAIPEKQNKV